MRSVARRTCPTRRFIGGAALVVGRVCVRCRRHCKAHARGNRRAQSLQELASIARAVHLLRRDSLVHRRPLSPAARRVGRAVPSSSAYNAITGRRTAHGRAASTSRRGSPCTAASPRGRRSHSGRTSTAVRSDMVRSCRRGSSVWSPMRSSRGSPPGPRPRRSSHPAVSGTCAGRCDRRPASPRHARPSAPPFARRAHPVRGPIRRAMTVAP